MDISRVSSTSGTKATGKSSGAKGASGVDFKSLVNIEEAEETEAATSIGGIRGMGTLLLAQEEGDSLEGRRRGRERAKKLIDDLEEIQMALLTGTISEAKLKSIAHTISQQRMQTDDPVLNALLDDIELRAAVEMAKLGMA